MSQKEERQDPGHVLPGHLGSSLDLDSQGDLSQVKGGQWKALGMRRALEHSAIEARVIAATVQRDREIPVVAIMVADYGSSRCPLGENIELFSLGEAEDCGMEKSQNLGFLEGTRQLQ